VSDAGGMARVAKDYFQELFRDVESVRSPVLQAIRRSVTDEDINIYNFLIIILNKHSFTSI
jgi:hypothetical protein